MYRNATVRELRREWEKERLLYLRKIDELLDKLLVASGMPLYEPPFAPEAPPEPPDFANFDEAYELS